MIPYTTVSNSDSLTHTMFYAVSSCIVREAWIIRRLIGVGLFTKSRMVQLDFSSFYNLLFRYTYLHSWDIKASILHHSGLVRLVQLFIRVAYQDY